LKSKLSILSICFLTFSFTQLKAQDTLQINEVVKTASLQKTFKNSNEELIDSTLQAQYKNTTIDEVLAIQTSSIIKSHGGLGNLSSISLRGCGANHVSINWNGFAINSATTGGADLSLIQTGFFEEIKLIPGASSSLYGSGTFGGALELNNSFKLKKGLNVNIGSEIGSFKTNKYFADFTFVNKKINYKLSVNKIIAKNNFPFIDKYKFDKPIEERQHNSIKSLNIIQNFMLKLPKNNSIESGMWYILKEKEIPEIAGTFNSGNKMQNDSIFRTYFRWNKFGKKYLLTASSAFFSEYLHYTDNTNKYDTEFSINSKIKANNYFADVSYHYYIKNNFILDFSGIINHQKIHTSNYKKNNISETNYSIIYSIKYSKFDYDFKFSFRNEILDDFKYIPLLNFGINKYFLKNKLLLKTNFSNKFRRATFNEKYWEPGGNINIKHEKGNSTELTFKYFYRNKSNNNLNITLYHSTIKDMIQWVQKNGVWSAQNNKNVKISGIETNINQEINLWFIKSKLIASYNFTNAMLVDVYSKENFESPQKLVYTPENTAKLYITNSYKKITFSWASQYTGKLFTTQENNEDNVLPFYFLSNIYASYNIDLKKIRINLNTKILNIFNRQYEMIKSYPTSGRAFYFGIVLKFRTKNAKILRKETQNF